MLERTLSFSNLGSNSQIVYVLDLLTSSQSKLSDLRTACVSYEYAFSQSFDGLISLLEWLELIAVTDVVTLKKKVSSVDVKKIVLERLFVKLSHDNHLHLFINDKTIFFDKSIFVKNNVINLRYSAIRNLLINFSLFEKDSLIKSQYVVNKINQEWFIEFVLPLIEKSEKKSRSLASFKSRQKTLEQLGAEAEKFVLDYERKKRSSHMNVDKIKIISNDNVEAGYDIKSYLTDNSLLFDKLIEVKSYKGEVPYFYWSINEVDTAKEKRDIYWLCLVNRDEMDLPNYEPLMIQDPYVTVIENDEWDKSIDKYKIVHKVT